MSIRSIGRRMAQTHPKLYVAGAKIGKYVYWGKRLFCAEYEETGKKIALLYLKYGNTVIDEKPDESKHAYCIAAKYAPPGWKARLMEKKSSVFERRGQREGIER